ncbi:MAG: hypothetical protein M3Y31_10870 [Gemmatimonadota bacterium]|nr:hypothetical protein [Gemmatimonadota bacterium]
MMLLILVLSVHLVVVSARLGAGDAAETYSDGSGPLATLSVARVAAAVE